MGFNLSLSETNNLTFDQFHYYNEELRQMLIEQKTAAQKQK